jgi:hypothetical protein
MKKYIFFVIAQTLLCIPPSPGNKLFNFSPYADDSLQVIEKVYLHVDRDTYYAGDDIWFKAYLVDALDHMLTDHSSNLHVELISPSSEIISNRIIRIDRGSGNGDFKLPDDIRSGRYRIRAYTNYMRNFSDKLFFTKEISVVNANDGQYESSGKVEYVKNNIRLDFFPEGGSLIDNVSSIIAFKAVDNLGKGCDVTGKIYSSDGGLVTTFKSTHLGMGSFSLRPLQGLSYYSVIRGKDSVDVKAELPASFPTGVTFSASINQDHELLISTRTNSRTLPLVSEHDLVLSLSIRKEIINKITFRIKSLCTSTVIPIDYLPDGILMLTLSTTEDLPLSERLIYIERETPLKIQIGTDKNIYKKREPVKLRLSLSGDSTLEREGNISLAVVDERLINNTSKFSRTISSWFLLESDIRGTIEDPSYYFDSSNPDRSRDMDLLLLTQGWRDFAWKYDTVYFPPENGFTISGKLRKDNKNKPIEGSRVSIGIFGSMNSVLTTIPVDSTGKFKLTGIDLSGESTVIVSGIDKKDHLNGLLTLDSATYNPAGISDSLLNIPILEELNEIKLISYYTINESIKKKYKLSDTINLGTVNIVAERRDPQLVKVESSRMIYSKPDDELVVTKQMESYRSIPELMKGKFPGVEVIGPRPSDPEYLIYIRGIASVRGPQLPLVLIDGIEADFKDLTRIPVSEIDRIDILKLVSSTVIYGFRGANGVINLITKAGSRYADNKPDNFSAKLRIYGYNAPRIFYSPQHLSDSTSAFKPDLRYTLYWNPDIILEDNKEIVLDYYNGDNSSLIRVIAEGITTSGIPVTGRTEYEVR